MASIVWKILYFVSFFCCVLLVVWIELSPEGRLEIETAIRQYNGIIISLGTLFIILLVGLLTTILTNHYAERREALNRQIAAALALANFRQEWINSLRADLADFCGKSVVDVTTDDDLPGGVTEEEAILASKILLRMNPQDEDYESLLWNLRRTSESRRDNTEADLKEVNNLRRTSQKILKREWERLKEDLERAQIDLEEHP